jgi:NAD(P)-dependent dehydrogenase (short-subunit alcohol dehydrogenase family)
MDDIWLIIVQLLVVGSILGSLLTYLLRGLVCRASNEIGTKSVLITGCDTGIGNELAKHFDSLGFHVFAGCLETASEGAQRLRVECSLNLKLVNMDVTREDHVQHAVQYVRDNLPSGEQGKLFNYLIT